MAIKAVLWDFDGTLVSSLEGIYWSMCETMKLCNYPAPTIEEVRATVGLTLDESMRRLTHPQCAEEQIPELIACYRNFYNSDAAPLVRLFDGACEVLSYLKRKGIASIVVSNKGRGLNQAIAWLGLERQFDAVFNAHDVAYRKPDPRLYTNHIAPLLAVSAADEVMVVGDTEVDLRFAQNAGLRSCWASYGYGDHAVCAGLNPRYTISSLAEVSAIIDSIH
ncbi:MAG: HAD family hydrolase [Acidobacteriaceae bacterium]|nr:HAD family hydrolase [Acidobacteriaceae bacterium]